MAGPRLRIVARIGLPRSPHGRFVLGSLIAHALFVAVMLLVPTLRPKPEFDDTYFVQLAPALPGKAAPAPAVSPRQPTRPKPAPATEGVRVESVEPKKVEPDKPKPKPDPPREPEPEEPAVDPAATSSPDFEPEPEAAGNPDGAAGDGRTSIASPEGWDNELAWYRTSVTAALYSNWQRPILSGNVVTLEVAVEFEILRDGSVRGLEVTAQSGVPSLDRSALRAVADASPLPPLPAQWKAATLPARFIFQLHPEEY